MLAGSLEENSSIGRAPVSKTGGCGFESLFSCHLWFIGFAGPFCPEGLVCRRIKSKSGASKNRGIFLCLGKVGTLRMAKTNPGQFVREVRQELAKVTWPTRKETLVTTAMVFVMVMLVATFFFFVDQLLSVGVEFVLGLGG